MGLYQSNILQSGLLQEAPVGYTYYITVYSAATEGSFTLPSGVTEFTAVCIGGGAAGWGGGIDNTGYPGGGGGGLGSTNINTSESGFTYYYSVGAGGNGATGSGDMAGKRGNHTTISGSTYDLLVRGSGGGFDDIGGVPITTNQMGGGTITYYPNVGDTIYNGANGISGSGTPVKKTGGGGGAAGTNGAGSVGTQSDGNRGVGLGGSGASNYGGDGGDSFPVDTELGWQYGNGSAGKSYGGGGGGGASSGVSGIGYGGNGSNGLLIIAYSLPNY